jgi:hypothetical protein
MNVIDAGRSYELNAGSVLHFVQRDAATKVRAGTTNEEVLEALIHRVTDAYQLVPCQETVRALYLLHEALMAFRQRTARRVSARVEGTNQPHDSEADCERFARLKSILRNEGDEALFEERAESRCA